MTFEVGRVVMRRQFQRADLLSRVWVGRVAADDQHGLWLWVATGSAYLDIAAADGRAFRDVPFGEWGRTDKALRWLTWGGDVLMLHPSAAAHSVWLFFDPDGAFRTWYVNLEDPVTRFDDGTTAVIDTVDHDLDIVVAPDRTWRWKDSDEFAAHLAHPDVYWVRDETAVWAEGERVVKLIDGGQFPFDGSRTDFRPDPSWTVPAMPPEWNRPRARG